MIGRRAVAGLSLLCALMFCAVAVQSASAQIGTKSVNTTAFTCVKGGGLKDFKDAHCDEFVGVEKGEFGHVVIKNDETTEIEVTNEKTTDNTLGAEPATFKSTLGGVSVHIVCNKATGSTAANKSFIHNVETEGKHTVTGTSAIRFTECKVEKPAKCVVKEPIELLAIFEGVEGLENTATKEKDTMGVLFKPHSPEVPFVSVTLANKGAESCALNGKVLEVYGTAIATGKPAPKKETKHAGATPIYETGNDMETIELGKGTGAKVEATGRATNRMASGGNPITLTTVT